MNAPSFDSVLNRALAWGRSQGYIARRIRIHPIDYTHFVGLLRRYGVESGMSDGMDRLYGVELIKDETCVEGPKIDWIEPLTQDKIDALHRYLSGATDATESGDE